MEEINPRDPWPEGFLWPLEELELLTNICDLTNVFFVILRCKSSK